MSLELIGDPEAHCTNLRVFTFRLRWVADLNLVDGTELELRSGQLRAFSAWRYVRFAATGGDITWRWKSSPNPTERWHNRERRLVRVRLPYGIRRGEAVEITVEAIPPIFAGVDNELSMWVLDAGAARRAAAAGETPAYTRIDGDACALSVKAGPVERVSVYSDPAPGLDSTVRTAVVPEDRFGNPSSFRQPVAGRLAWCGKEQELTLHGVTHVSLASPSATARAVLTIPMAGLGSEENVANGARDGANLVVTGNPVWPDSPGGLRPAFGEIHWHTDLSADGARPLAEALRCARDELNLQFAAPGDHNPRGDTWQATVDALEAANEDDRFVTFFGWENSSAEGHENYYFTEPDHPLVCEGSAGILGGRPAELAPRLRDVYAERPFLGIPHHTNSVAETRREEDDTPYWYPYDWTGPQPYLRLIEIMQTRGNQERNDYTDAWRGWHQRYGASVQDALAQGLRLGFTGGTDNHCGWPGRAWEACEGAGNHPQKSVILTGAWAERVARQPVFDALMARHTWAVWDTRALVWFAVNGTPGGSDLTVTKRIALRNGENAVYIQHELTGFSGKTSLGHHATLAPPAKGTLHISTSPLLFGQTSPRATAYTSDAEYYALASNRRFRNLNRVPTVWKDAPYTDCSVFPARKGFVDILSLYAKPSSSPAWTCATAPETGYLWFALKDPAVQPATTIWMENCGRHDVPWNGHNCCIGLEDVCGYHAEGLKASVGKNDINAEGIPTCHTLTKRKPTVVNYIQGAVRIPRGFDKVKRLRFQKDAITFVAASGKSVSAPVRHSFIATGMV